MLGFAQGVDFVAVIGCATCVDRASRAVGPKSSLVPAEAVLEVLASHAFEQAKSPFSDRVCNSISPDFFLQISVPMRSFLSTSLVFAYPYPTAAACS